jgi:hypothetical protein
MTLYLDSAVEALRLAGIQAATIFAPAMQGERMGVTVTFHSIYRYRESHFAVGRVARRRAVRNPARIAVTSAHQAPASPARVSAGGRNGGVIGSDLTFTAVWRGVRR